MRKVVDVNNGEDALNMRASFEYEAREDWLGSYTCVLMDGVDVGHVIKRHKGRYAWTSDKGSGHAPTYKKAVVALSWKLCK